MGLRDQAWEIIKWHYMKKRLGYNELEMTHFREQEKNENVLNKIPEMNDKVIVVEVIESRGCNSQHKKGDVLYFDIAGNLITTKAPEKVCVFALNSITMQIFTAGELLLADADPNKMRFNQAACFDVGVECGGWGQIIMEVRVENNNS